MADNLIELKSVREFAREIDLDIATVTQTLTLKVFRGVVFLTPVDTGRARSGWQIGIGSIPSGNPSSSSSPPASPSVSSIDGKQKVFIVNNVTYIIFLEAGHSDQAPSGMVAVTMAQIQGEIDTVIRSVA